jgi:hypothetical protein
MRGSVVLFNIGGIVDQHCFKLSFVYGPRVDPEREDRQVYQMRFYALLQTRAEALLQNGRYSYVNLNSR